MTNYMELKFNAISENEAFSRNVVACFCLALNPTVTQLDDIKTAVSEAVTNCVVHAYEGKGGEVIIKASIEDTILHIDILDSGKGISDIEKALKPFFTTKASDERTGMGFTIMGAFMNELKVKNNELGGVTVSMTKNLDEKERSE